MQTFYTDLLCVGAGLAGERVAIEAAGAGFDAICLSIVPARRSHSSAAQGGMQGALANCLMGEGDSTDVHFGDTVKGSDWGCDQVVARKFADTAPIAIKQLAHWGVPWNRVVPGKSTYYQKGEKLEKTEREESGGLITARNFGGTAKWRTAYTSDGTGHCLLYTMDNKATQAGVVIHDKVEAISLIHNGETCTGVVARCLRTGQLRVYLARCTMIASGSFGRIFRESTNAVINEAGGHIMALDTGVAPLGNMEAVQFHPTGIVPTNILITEGCRGDGGTLKDVNGERFMQIYEPKAQELASRDVVSRWMTHHMRQGKGVPSEYGEHLWLDIRHLGAHHLKTKLREVREICINFLGVDPITDMVPVRPTQHYSMGGLRTDANGACYGLKGLFSAGEAACWDLHGFNRLGGNSLAETVVAGMLVGAEVVKFLEGYDVAFDSAVTRAAVRKQEARIQSLISGAKGKESCYALRNSMQDALMEGAGVFRNGPGLTKAIDTLTELLHRSRQVGLRSDGAGANPELRDALKIEGQIKVALCIAHGALNRTESRGSHTREDFPARNDRDWLNRTLAIWPSEDADAPVLSYEPATVGDPGQWEMPPGDRGYGGGSTISYDSAPQD